MKRISKSIVLWLTVLVCGLVAVCGYVSFGDKSKEDVFTAYAEETTVDNGGWYKFTTYSSTNIEFLLSGDFKDYKSLDTADFTKLKNDVISAVKDMFIENIINNNGNGGGSAYSAKTEAVASAFSSFASTNLPEDFDWSSVEKLPELKDYVVDRLGDHNEFEKYVNGDYDMLIDFVIDAYVSSKDTEEEKQQAYDKIQDALKDVVSEAYDTAVESAKENQVDFNQSEWDKYKADAETRVEERVKNVQQSGGVTITTEQILAAISSVSLDDNVLYKNAVLKSDGIRYILTKFPKPATIANMTDKQMESLLSFEVKIETTFGDVKFDFNFGFFGDCSNIRKTLGKLAEYFDLSVNGNSVSLNVNVPAGLVDVLAKFYQSSRFSQESKDLVFDFFGKKVSEIPAYTLTELTNFVRGTDFSGWLKNLIDASYINNYFGNYITEVFGRPLTDNDIKTLINDVHGLFAPKMETLSSMTVDEVKEWIIANVPRASELLNSQKLTAVAEKLLAVAKKIDWAKYDYDYIVELLADDSQLNDRIYSYVDRLEDFESYYDTFTKYLAKVIDILPENLQNASLVSVYDGEKFTGSADGIVDLDDIFKRISTALKNRGFEALAEKVSDASLAIDKDTFNFALDVTVNVPNLYQITYENGGEIVKTGFLPFGVNEEVIKAFAGMDSVGGFEILYWVDDNGQRVEQMPESNVTLVPFLAYNVAISPEKVEKTYDGVESVITATVNGGNAENVYEYKWYKNDELISNSGNELKVKNVADSGKYCVEVTLVGTDITVKSEIVAVAISPKVLDLSSAVWTPTENTVTYNGNSTDVAIDLSKTALSDDEKNYILDNLTYTVNGVDDALSFTDAGKYEINAIFNGADSNYSVENFSIVSQDIDYTFTIEKASVKAEFSTVYTNAFVYNGSEQGVEINCKVMLKDGSENLDKIFSTVQSGEYKAINAGNYNATLTVIITDGNYVLEGNDSYALEWSISQKTIDVSVTWAYSGPYTYNGTAQGVTATVNSDGLGDIYTTVIADDSKINAGEYTATVTLTIKDEYENNYTFANGDEYSDSQEWLIKKAEITAPVDTWSVTDFDFVYGDTISITYTGLGANADYFTAVIYEWKKGDQSIEINGYAWNVGNDYKVTAKFALKDSANYVVKGDTRTEFTFAKDIIVTPKVVNLSQASWEITPPTTNDMVYDGKEYTITLNLDGVSNVPQAIKDNIIYKVNGTVTPASELKFTNADTYIIEATFADGNYKVEGVPTCEFTISQKTIAKGDVSVSLSDTEFEYTGSDITVTATVAIGGLTENQDFTVVKTGDWEKRSVGKYKAIVTITLTNDNYKLAYDAEVFELEWEIKEASTPTVDYWGVGYEFEALGVTVKDVDGKVSKDLGLAVSKEELDVEKYKEKLEELFAGKNPSVLFSYDIHFANDGNAKQPVSGKFNVSIPIPEEYRGYADSRLAVIHIKDNGEVTVMTEAKRVGDNMEFETDGFSIFSVILLDDTGLSWVIILLIIIAVLLLANLIILIILIIKHKKGGKDDGQTPAPEEAPATEEEISEQATTEEVKEELSEAPTAPTQDVAPFILPTDGSAMIVRSFSARLAQSNDELKKRYSELKNYVLSFNKVRSKLSWNYDAFYCGRKPVCKILIKGKTLTMFVALDPDTLAAKYFHESVKHIAKYEKTPTKLKIRSDRALKYAKEFIAMVMESYGVAQGEIPTVDYVVNNATDNELFLMGLIKIKKIKSTNPWAKSNASDTEAPASDTTENAQGVADEAIEDESETEIINRVIIPEDMIANGSATIVRSFASRVAQSSEELKDRYSELKNFILSFTKVRSKLSWNYDAFYSGRKPVCKILIKGKTLTMLVALDPDTLAAKYFHESVKDIAKYASTPTKLKIRSNRALKYAKELVAMVMAGYGVAQGEVTSVDYVGDSISDDELLLMGMIKVKKAKSTNPWAKTEVVTTEEVVNADPVSEVVEDVAVTEPVSEETPDTDSEDTNPQE